MGKPAEGVIQIIAKPYGITGACGRFGNGSFLMDRKMWYYNLRKD